MVNNSYAGSTIFRCGYQPANSPWRLARLKHGDILPDAILIFSGLNDVAFYKEPAEFEDNYREMLLELHQQFPAAQLYCATLCKGALKHLDTPVFINFKACTPLSQYNDAIRTAVTAADAHLVDLAAYDTDYSSMDGAHPDGTGMRELAAWWLHSITP